MLEVLKYLNYTVPNIKAAKIDNLEVVHNNTDFTLKVDGQTWMQYFTWSHMQAAQVFSHYYLAKGDVIVSGLGFAAREQWLLNNPNVKSLTILEANQTVIEFHQKLNTPILNKARIIHTNASTYIGSCDTLLLDHYEMESMETIVEDVCKIAKNINHKTLWFWPFETIILADCHGRDPNTLYIHYRNNEFSFDLKSLGNVKLVYERFKQINNLPTLPQLSDCELRWFLAMFTGFFQYL